MKKLAIAIMVLLGWNVVAYAEDVFIHVVADTYKPYQYEEDGVVKGIATEIVRAVLDRAGFKYDVNIYPWARAYDMALNKKNVLINSILRTPIRENLFTWVRPVALSEKVFLYKLPSNTKIKINSLEDAKNYNIGVMRESAYHQFLKKEGFLKIDPVTHNVQSIKKILKNRLDLILKNEPGMLADLKDEGLPSNALEPVFLLFEQTPFIAMNKNTSTEVVERMKTAYDELAKEGEIAIYTK